MIERNQVTHHGYDGKENVEKALKYWSLREIERHNERFLEILGYRYGFNGMEKDDEVKGSGNSLDFGARVYDARLGRFLSIDPHAGKYSYLSPYAFVANMPIIAIDPDGKDIIVLTDPKGANGSGHQALLIGNNKDGWVYISKDGASGNIFGSKPKFTVVKFKNIEEFRNSPHNFILADDEYHSDIEGNINSDPTYLLDENGNKTQRYTEAFFIKTEKPDGTSTDKASIKAGVSSAVSEYVLGSADCSHVVTDGLEAGESSTGTPLRSGENGNYRPNSKLRDIEKNNIGADADKYVVPDDLKLKDGEKGKEGKR